MNHLSSKFTGNLLPTESYNTKEENSIMEFTKHFYGIRLVEKDFKTLKDFLDVKKLRKKAVTPSKIAKELGIPQSRVDRWIYKESIPIIARLHTKFKQLGKPDKNNRWLSSNSSRGGILTGPWVQVPMKINGFGEIKETIDSITPLEETLKKAEEFDISAKEFEEVRYELFYYLLGLIVGDGAIVRGTGTKRITRRITLSMSKRYPTNERVGKFVVLCANSIGLRMHRTKDGKPSRKNKHKFYRWIGQCSPLVEWISDVCFGLEEGQNTTYFPIKAEWILKSPVKLRIAFLQGIADSDGYVDIGVFQVGLITKSNILLLEKILDSIGIHYTRKYLHHMTLPTAMLPAKDAYKLPIFNPHIKSYRWKLVKNIAEAKRLPYKLPEKLGKEVTENLKKGASSIDIVKMLLHKYNILIRETSVQKRIRTLKKHGVIQT